MLKSTDEILSRKPDRSHTLRISVGAHIRLDPGYGATVNSRLNRALNLGTVRYVLEEYDMRCGEISFAAHDNDPMRGKAYPFRKDHRLTWARDDRVRKIGFGTGVVSNDLEILCAV